MIEIKPKKDESIYEWQRRVFAAAVVEGWTGKTPSVLGTYNAHMEFESARAFLKFKGLWQDA
jgi:hypothetical protein